MVQLTERVNIFHQRSFVWIGSIVKMLSKLKVLFSVYTSDDTVHVVTIAGSANLKR